MGRDLWFAWRELRRSPGFALAAVLSLALGIGVNAAIFTLTNALFLRPLPVASPDRLAQVETVDQLTRQTPGNFTRSPVSLPNLRDFRAASRSFEALAGFAPIGATLGGRAVPRPVAGQLVTLNYFAVLGLRPVLGRFFNAGAAETPGAYPQVVLSHGLWTSEFQADPSIVGQKIILNSSPFEVVGVAPSGFKGTTAIGTPNLVWIPLTQHRDLLSGLVEELFETRRFRVFNAVGRLRPGVTVAQADAELRTISARLEREYPLDNRGRLAVVSPLNALALGLPRDRLVLINAALLGAASLVLLIACVNVANLLLVRSAARARELGVRAAIGASRGRLIRQLVTESLLLAGAGCALGLLLAWWGKEKLWEFRPAFLLANDVDLSLDFRVLGFAVLCALATGLLFGLAPAWRASSPDLHGLLRAGGGRGTTAGSGSLRSLLVAAEVAFCFVALTGAGAFVRSMQRVERIDPGFETERLFAADINLATIRQSGASASQLVERLLETARATPGAAAAAVTSARPLGGAAILGTYFKEGQRGELGERGMLAVMDSCSASLFATLGVPLRQGRLLTDFDRAGTLPVAVINEAFARQMWPGEDPLGKRFFRLRDNTLREVVGVVANTARFSIGEEPLPSAYFPREQVEQPALTLVVRTAADPRPVLAAALRRWQPVAPGLAFNNPATIGEMVATGLWAPRMGAALFGLFGLLGLVLAAIGVHGVVAQGAADRTKEMGIRLALGCPARSVAGLILRQGLWPALLGVAAGVTGALGFARWTASLLFETSAADPALFAAMAMVLLVAALVAGALPAWRLARLDPNSVLREQ